MKKFNIVDGDGNITMTVEANTAASARHIARRNGHKGFCIAVNVEEVPAIPGKAEYERFLLWATACDNTVAAENEADQEAARDILGAISGVYTRESASYPAFPLTKAETESARGYARFLGGSAYRDFERRIP